MCIKRREIEPLKRERREIEPLSVFSSPAYSLIFALREIKNIYFIKV